MYRIARTFGLACGLVLLGLGALWLAGLVPPAWGASTAPRFSGREYALRLAEILDKGIFRQKLISATFVESTRPGRYQLRILLSNGADLRWDLHQLRAWSQTTQLVLRGNQALVFPSLDDNRFVLLDKTRFAEQALKARVFIRHYEDHEPLAGQQIGYSVLRFQLASLLDLPPTSDSHGYQHVYAFDLSNGQRLFLSARQAYQAMQQGAMLEAPQGDTPVLERPYVLQSLRPRTLGGQKESGLARFSIELEFDQHVQLAPAHYPFQVFEQEGGQGFMLQFIIPNTVLRRPLPPLRNLEFLRNVKAVQDPATPGQTLVQALLTADVLNTPPEAQITLNRVNLVFTKVADQSVFNPQALRDATILHQQEQALTPKPTPQQVTRRQTYRRLYTAGLAQVDRAEATQEIEAALELQAQALVNFQQAAQSASSDDELESALHQRNLLIQTTPYRIARYVARSLQQSQNLDREKLIQLLGQAAQMTDDPTLLRRLDSLTKQLATPN